MRYFIDTEFWERGAFSPIHLISIGIVTEDGREFYREVTGSAQMVKGVNSDWLQQNVIPHLEGGDVAKSVLEISRDVVAFVGDDPSPEFWGYYSDYDWVVFCQMFGDMGALPNGWPYYCRDLRQSLDERGLHDIRQPDDAAHNALSDARWIAETAWNFLFFTPSL